MNSNIWDILLTIAVYFSFVAGMQDVHQCNSELDEAKISICCFENEKHINPRSVSSPLNLE